MPTGDDISPIKLIEQAWIQFLAEDPQRKEYYGDPERGASVVQAWRTTLAVGGMKLVCLLSSGKPDVDTGEIPVSDDPETGEIAVPEEPSPESTAALTLRTASSIPVWSVSLRAI